MALSRFFRRLQSSKSRPKKCISIHIYIYIHIYLYELIEFWTAEFMGEQQLPKSGVKSLSAVQGVAGGSGFHARVHEPPCLFGNPTKEDLCSLGNVYETFCSRRPTRCCHKKLGCAVPSSSRKECHSVDPYRTEGLGLLWRVPSILGMFQALRRCISTWNPSANA